MTGDQECACRALNQPGGDKRGGTRRHAADERGDRETGEPGAEQPGMTVPVTQARAGDHQSGEGEQAGGRDELQLGAARPESRSDRATTVGNVMRPTMCNP